MEWCQRTTEEIAVEIYILATAGQEWDGAGELIVGDVEQLQATHVGKLRETAREGIVGEDGHVQSRENRHLLHECGA